MYLHLTRTIARLYDLLVGGAHEIGYYWCEAQHQKDVLYFFWLASYTALSAA